MGFSQKTVLFMPCRRQDGVLVQVVGGSHDDRIHIRTSAERIQIGLAVAFQLFGNGLPVFRVQDGHDPGPFLRIHDAPQLRAEIAGADDGVADVFHNNSSL